MRRQKKEFIGNRRGGREEEEEEEEKDAVLGVWPDESAPLRQAPCWALLGRWRFS